MRILLSVLVALPFLTSVGCQSQPGLTSAPLLTAELVPPPGTRNPAPGTALPYYQPGPAAIQGAGLAPREPCAAAQVNAIPVTGVPISLPPDNQPLRMTPPATIPAVANDSPRPTTQAASPVSPDFTAPPAAPSLAWAAPAPPPATADTFATRSQPAPNASQAMYVAASTPRVRLPGYATPASYGQPAATNLGQVQITELPPPSYQPAPLAPSSGGDGFRARGSVSTGTFAAPY